MKGIFTSLFLISALAVNAQTPLMTEDFNSGIPSSWTMADQDGLTPASAVSQFTSPWISFTDNGDTCAASTSYYDPAGTSGDYLVSPKLSLATYSKLTWKTKSYDGSYPDGYLVMISTTDSLLASFTDTLLYVDAEYPYWTTHSIHLDAEGYANTDVFIAFANVTNDGFILMIDDVEVWVSDFATTEPLTDNRPVYPNPATDVINIPMDEQEACKIYSTDGQLVATSYHAQTSVSELEPGVYYIHYTRNGLPVQSSFVKK